MLALGAHASSPGNASNPHALTSRRVALLLLLEIALGSGGQPDPALLSHLLVHVSRQGGGVRAPGNACVTAAIEVMREGLLGMQSSEDLYEFLENMHKHLDTPDNAEMDFGDEVAPWKVAPASVFGMYIRRTLLLMHSMDFMRIRTVFQELRDEYCSDEDVPISHTAASMSTHDASKLVLAIHSQIGVLSFVQIEEAIDAIAARLVPSDVQYAQVHFLRYLNAVHHKEFQNGLNHLYRYFDYFYESEVVPSKNGAQPHTVKRVMKHHYAVLNLATFYYAFNHLQLSVLSVEDAIMMAERCNDVTALVLAVALLWRITQSTFTEHEYALALMHRCVSTVFKSKDAQDKKKAEEKDGAAKDAEVNGRTAGAARVARAQCHTWSAIAQSHLFHPTVAEQEGTDAFGTHGSFSSSSPSAHSDGASSPFSSSSSSSSSSSPAVCKPQLVWQALLRGGELINLYNLHEETCRQHMVRAAAWRQFGSRNLSQMSTAALLRSDVLFKLDSFDRVLALTNAVLDLRFERPLEAQRLLDFAVEAHPVTAACSSLVQAGTFLKFDAAVRQNRLQDVKRHATLLMQMARPKEENLSLYLECQFAGVVSLGMTGHAVDACAQWLVLYEQCLLWRQVQFAARALLALVAVYQRENSALEAMPHALQCLSLCQTNRLDRLYRQAVVALAELQLALQMPAQACSSVRRVLPHVLEHHSSDLQMRAYLVLGKAYLAMKPDSTGKEKAKAAPHSEKAKEYLIKALALGTVASAAQQGDAEAGILPAHDSATEYADARVAKQVFYWLAVASDVTGDVAARNEYARVCQTM